MVQAVIPTIPGREELLAEAVASFERHGIGCVVVENSPSCGTGWRIGLERATADLVLLASDDVEVSEDSWGFAEAVARARSGSVVCPIIFWPDGTLQGAGGYGLNLEDGAIAHNCIFPFAARDTLELISPWPERNHYCDVWVSEEARRIGRGPIVTYGFALVHKIVSPDTPGQYAEYRRWRRRRIPGRASRIPGLVALMDAADLAALQVQHFPQRLRVALGIRTRLRRLMQI
jgi:hypothetical protein